MKTESTHKGVNQRSKDVTQTQHQRPESPAVTPTWHASKYKDDDVPLAEFIYLEFTRMPGRSYRRRLGSLVVCLCDVFRALINSLGFWFCTCALGLVLFEIVNKNRQYITHTNYTSH